MDIIIHLKKENKKGFQFGNELNQIEKDVNDLQIKFYSEKNSWKEGDITK